MSAPDETIVAIATPPGQGGVAIVRLSGPSSLEIGAKLVPGVSSWSSHHLRYGALRDPQTGEVVDRLLAVYMEAPSTYTGEDVFEFHLHGSQLLAEWAVRWSTELGARLARPGEFTQRAFLHGKLDLTQAEAVGDLIASRHRQQARLAVQHLEGRFSQRVGEVRGAVLQWLTLLEAEIDFGDEIDELPVLQQRALWESLWRSVEALLQDAEQGRVSVGGLCTVLVGAPNAGKSSLLNALLGEERALVTPVPGTTRDRIEVECSLQGVVLQLIDTAGLRSESPDPIERLGMEKTRQALGRADYQVLVVDSHAPDWSGLEGQEIAPHLVLLNKSDLPAAIDPEELRRRFPQAAVERCCLLHESGREAAVQTLLREAKRRLTQGSGECFSLNQRHREALVRTRESLLAIEQTLADGLGAEFVALDLRRAAQSLGEILGLDITEEVLDRIFGQFCLGK